SSDFNYTIWGQLVRGYHTLDNFFDVPVTANNAPVVAQKIFNARIVNNTSDAVVLIKAKDVGNATITVTATENSGESDTHTFTVTAEPDEADGVPVNDPPILAPVRDLTVPTNKPLSFKLRSVDLEGDAVEFAVSVLGNP